ncbi:MAG: hypothetical protein BWY21_02050 [Parcubacteria group bacterium ADurb.Bin216]|nr:MAG: hypothetical protein BWY21_02050 [Parcubacteria group bacterium ADurb.Bin216]
MRKLNVIGIDFIKTILPIKKEENIKKIQIDWNIANIFAKEPMYDKIRKEMEEEGKLDLEEEFAYIDKYFECAQKDTLIDDLIACGLQEEKCN